jgi:hypothetical protein|tara:strand:- start:498 stop:1112 length:615 start_codon:yes stop_codon:yes gene_type:complete
MALVSVATLKAYLPEITGSSADTELTNMINRTESAIARYLDFPIADSGTTPVLTEQTYTLYLDGPMNDDPSVLASPIRPLVSVTSVHSDPNLVYDSSSSIGSAEYVIDKQLGRLILKPLTATSSFDVGYRNIKLVCVAGYSASNPPDDLVHAICVWCSQLQRGKANQGKDSITVRDSTVKISKRTIPEEVKQLIQPLRNYGSIL